MSENTDRSERMTGTPSKDRAEAHETPAEEFSRLVIEYNEGEGSERAEAWNLIADFACEHADTIIAAMNGTAHAKAFAEGMKRAAEYREQLAEVTDRFEQMAGATYATASDRRAIKKARELLNRGAE